MNRAATPTERVQDNVALVARRGQDEFEERRGFRRRVAQALLRHHVDCSGGRLARAGGKLTQFRLSPVFPPLFSPTATAQGAAETGAQ